MTDISRLIEQTRNVLLDEIRDSNVLAPLTFLSEEESLEVHNAILSREASRPSTKIKRSITCYGTKHHSCKGLSSLKYARIEDLLGPGANRGIYIRGVIQASQNGSCTPLHIVLQDGTQCINVAIHHAHWLKFSPGTTLVIREPFVKVDQWPFIRVDSPVDVTLSDTAVLPSEPNLRKSARQLKQEANAAFLVKDPDTSSNLANRALQIEAEDVHLRAVLYLNLAAFELDRNLPGSAEKACLAILQNPQMLESLDSPQLQKLHQRLSLARYGCRRFSLLINEIDNLVIKYPHSKVLEDLQLKTRMRIKEGGTGRYNWTSLYRNLLEGKNETMADYLHPSVKASCISERRGRGLVATSAVTAGALLLMEHPIACSFTPTKSKVMALDMATESVVTDAETALPGLVYRRIVDTPDLCRSVNALYAGPNMSTSSACDFSLDRYPIRALSELVVDAGRIELACTYNAFTVESIVSGTPRGSALYLLASLVNHACLGNCVYSFWNGIYVLHALVNIPEGEELTASYVNPTLSFSERASKLKHHTTSCDCSLCDIDSEDDEKLRAKRTTLMHIYAEEIAQSPQANGANPSLPRCNQLIKTINRTYASSRLIRPEMNKIYRSLGRVLDESKCPAMDIMEAEAEGLECLGVIIDRSGVLPRGYLHSTVPAILNQNCVLACMHIARLAESLSVMETAKHWDDLAERIHSIIIGPDILHERMRDVALTS